MSTLGFRPRDFQAFAVADFDARIELLYRHIHPKMVKLGEELAPELSRTLNMKFFLHMAKHARAGVKPPGETWAAFGPSPKAYKRYGYLALCISRAGLHARAVMKSEADHRSEVSAKLRAEAAQLAKSMNGSRIARYERWDFARLPPSSPATAGFFTSLADALDTKAGIVDVGFGWTAGDAVRLDREELLDAMRELEPLYRIFCSVT